MNQFLRNSMGLIIAKVLVPNMTNLSSNFVPTLKEIFQNKLNFLNIELVLIISRFE